MEDDDDFFDTVSVNSAHGKRRYLSLSRNTVYHSLMDLDGGGGNDLEMASLDQNKVGPKRVVNTYEQWKNRRWRNFSSSDLSVDFVLAYDDQGEQEDVDKRVTFEQNLESTGLLLEREENQRIHFVKIHVPKDVTMRFAEILKLRLPIKDEEQCPLKDNIITKTAVKILQRFNVMLDPEKFPVKKYQLTAEFNKDKNYLFDIDDPDFFNTSVKITVVSYILEREKFGKEDQDKGIKRLIAENVYKAAYPLHDVSIFFLFYLYSYFRDVLSNLIKDTVLSTVLSFYQTVRHTNHSIQFCRYSAEIAHRWGLTGFDLQAEPPRPEYLLKLANAKKKKLNVVTQLQEPVVPFWRVKLPSLILSFSTAFFCTLITLGVVTGVVVYRMSIVTSDFLHSDNTSYRIYVVPITAGLINLTCIVILNFVYGKLAQWLTEMELQRTQTEFEESLTIKIYMFQFVNYYSSIFYIAFIKGKFVGYPAKYNKIFGYRQEECNPGGCLMELTMQLAIIMIGNQAVNNVMETLIPLCLKMYKTFVVTTGIEKTKTDEVTLISCNQWTEDYKLTEAESSLFSEYLEMVLQYGFITIFVTAFPLAPLLALINNVLEMRLDAKKFIKYYRRPVPQRVKNIGVWYSILAFIGRLSVASNAFIIAFSSHFIPKLVYKLKISGDHTEDGFLEHSLAYFNTSHFPAGSEPAHPAFNVSVCRYNEYRNHYSFDDETRYKRPLIYWHILAARLAFIVAYQNLVSFVMTAVQWMIPDISRKLNDRIKREAYRTNEIIIHNETQRARQRKESMKKKKRDSMMSTSTVYYDAINGDVGTEEEPARSATYYDI
uniref:Anoctamin n=1 Tax=Diabrotica virgifera virgifera TaxID=50390 RepID=A0A6P7FJS9_DIAVI